MRIRPILLLAAMAVAQLTGFIHAKQTGPRYDLSFEAAGIFYLLMLGPAFAVTWLGMQGRFARKHASIALVCALMAFAWSLFLLGMRDFGAALGQVLTLQAAKTVILAWPVQAAAVASGVAALISLTLVIAPESSQPVFDDQPID